MKPAHACAKQPLARACSPVPMNVIGLRVAATALSAPPPLACPSSFVMMTWPTCRGRGKWRGTPRRRERSRHVGAEWQA